MNSKWIIWMLGSDALHWAILGINPIMEVIIYVNVFIIILLKGLRFKVREHICTNYQLIT